ncbi:hypothetical protein KUCAC02_018035 [Chaenocephalus aceratus]|uniref:Uncharacterized protein n=1 Tax=Chaenocephalus aceratus TaxID=36190 RepID=A0ACB9W801_CHAAC|nr:hypothetical protein KUCAC02_018035 [Chaenocephalus aceratus]
MKTMKPTHKALFILCPTLVLGFIYYSSGKLHLHVWGPKPQSDAEETTVVLTKGAEVKRIPELETEITGGRIVGSVYDKQGFLLQLDTKLPQELAYKYGNLSEGACKPGYAAAKMTTIYPKFMKPAPMFLDRNFKLLAKVSNYLPPFGFKTQEKVIDSILTATKYYGLGEHLDSLSCKRCIIVGNGGILFNKSLGSRIDEYDVVVRLNEAPVKGYRKDVGTKTTIRITYPEGAIQKSDNYEKDSLFVFFRFQTTGFQVAQTDGLQGETGKPDHHSALSPRFKVGPHRRSRLGHRAVRSGPCLTLVVMGVWRQGFHTLGILREAKSGDTTMTSMGAERGTEGFWKSVAHYVPREPTEMRILNPYFIQEAAFQFIGLPLNNGLMGKGNIPTLGTVAITMALHNCDEVAVAGFGYDMNTPHAPLHYYETVKMSAIKESWTHNISKEKEFLRKLVKANIITDMTNGI